MTSPIIIRGIEYPSKEAVAAAFGISIPSVRNAIRLGRTEFIGIPAHKTRKRTGTDPMPMRIAGKVYPDAHAAAKALKVSVKTIYSALSTGREDFVGLGRKRKHRRGTHNLPIKPRPVQIGPVSFPSMKAAAVAFGVSIHTVKRHVDAGDTQWLVARVMDITARAEGHRGAAPPSMPDSAREQMSQMGRDRWNARRQKEEARSQ